MGNLLLKAYMQLLGVLVVALSIISHISKYVDKCNILLYVLNAQHVTLTGSHLNKMWFQYKKVHCLSRTQFNLKIVVFSKLQNS